MGGFNPINLIINTIGVVAASYNRTQSAANNTAASNETSIYTTSQYTTDSSSSLSVSNQTTISTVEVEQQANYIKDLLNLPRDFQTLINQIQGANPNEQALKELSKLLQNGKINLNALTALLSGNSQNAAQKIMAAITAVSKMGANNVNQLKELMGMLNNASSTMEASQMVKNLLMLYLPWLPLSMRNNLNLDFRIDIFDKIEGPDPNTENPAEIIKIMIQTANYRNIMATLELAANNDVNVFISAIESFPEKEVLSAFNKENKKSDIRANVTVEKNKDPGVSEHLKQNIQITSSNYVSPKLVLAAHSLIKIIIEVDSLEFIINEEEN